VAIGAPLGLSNTVTKGIVSALNRTIQVASAAAPDNSSGGGLQFYSGSGDSINLRVIQTDAAINPGNSGGALLNQQGLLIGINVAIANAGGTAGSIGVGFAIPSNVAKRIAEEIMATGSASHGLLGAMVSDSANSDAAASFSVGAKVVKLTSGGAAEKAGVLEGDIVTKFNGVAITSASELTAAVRQEKAGAKATLELIRAGKTLTLSVVLGDAGNQ
jgi:putative serine protease PepD